MSFLDSMTPQMAADMARPVYEENQLLRARLAQLTAEHFEAPPGMVGHHCGYCHEDWPCETIRIAGGDPDEDVAAPAPDPLAPVYKWLVETLAFPYDLHTDEKPPWLDLHALAAEWAAQHDEDGHGDTIEDWAASILSETGWPEEGATP